MDKQKTEIEIKDLQDNLQEEKPVEQIHQKSNEEIQPEINEEIPEVKTEIENEQSETGEESVVLENVVKKIKRKFKKFECGCGKTVAQNSSTKHNKSKCHQDFLHPENTPKYLKKQIAELELKNQKIEPTPESTPEPIPEPIPEKIPEIVLEPSFYNPIFGTKTNIEPQLFKPKPKGPIKKVKHVIPITYNIF